MHTNSACRKVAYRKIIRLLRNVKNKNELQSDISNLTKWASIQSIRIFDSRMLCVMYFRKKLLPTGGSRGVAFSNADWYTEMARVFRNKHTTRLVMFSWHVVQFGHCRLCSRSEPRESWNGVQKRFLMTKQNVGKSHVNVFWIRSCVPRNTWFIYLAKPCDIPE